MSAEIARDRERPPVAGAGTVSVVTSVTARVAASDPWWGAARLVVLLLGVALLGLAAACGGSGAAEPGEEGQVAESAACAVPSASASTAASLAPVAGRTEIATFAAGCFWGVEAHFAALPGVVDVVVGYTGGTTADPTYEEVCSDDTGHAEAVRVQYDPDVITYEELLEDFFDMHDPTTLDRQGPDMGPQYRSAVFFHTPGQEATARAVMGRVESARVYAAPIVTQIAPAGPFWRAEEYHQDYFER